jgi:hypothetical protein
MDAENFIEYFDNAPPLLWPVILVDFFVSKNLNVLFRNRLPARGVTLQCSHWRQLWVVSSGNDVFSSNPSFSDGVKWNGWYLCLLLENAKLTSLCPHTSNTNNRAGTG